MESQRSLLFIALMVVTYLLFSQWQQQNAVVPEQISISQNQSAENVNSDFVPESSDAQVSSVKSTDTSAKLITVTTDTF
ncbi:MAG TPA: membrane protein insertase YidC, partial [Colwellia sp.]|nr:membrane protein insertase YidC [Colwellia sp.]